MKNVKVCFVARDDLFTKRGGDTILCELYASFVLNSGGEVEYWLNNDDYVHADIYHAFNIDRPLEIYPRLYKVKKAKKSFVITSLHHPNEWVERFRIKALGMSVLSKTFYSSPIGNTTAKAEKIKEWIRMILSKRLEGSALTTPWLTRVQWILAHADKVLLQANREKKYIQKDFDCILGDDQCTSLPNPSLPVDNNDKESRAKDVDILFVGRIEVRKNILTLIEVANKLKKSLLIIGKENPNEKKYGMNVARLVRDNYNINWIKGVTRDELQNHYRKAKVLVNPSYVEVSPVVDIEALANGCPIITTRNALHHEFLPEGTKVIDPYSIVEIEEALQSDSLWTSKANVPSEGDLELTLLSIYRGLI